ncbi:MAG: DUF2177 family protein [Pseudomonadota bacterium]
MAQLAVAYLATAVVFLVLDALWLGRVATHFYKSQLGALLAQPFNLPAAAGFYLIYCVGIIIFAVSPSLASGNWVHAALYGGLFGFFCYATYNMTNMATIRNWPFRMSVVDMGWGTVLTAVSAAAGTLTTRMLFG